MLTGGGGSSSHWVRKEVLMDHKNSGGLGFKDLRALNIAFLMKQAWRMLSRPELLGGGDWIWSPASSGIFSVSTAYDIVRLLDNRRCFYKGDGSSMVCSASFWKTYWKLNIPQKVKLFGWRALHNCLPDGVNMLRRGLAQRFECIICRFDFENVLHLVKNCWWAKAVTAKLGFEGELMEVDLSTFREWLRCAMEKLCRRDLCLLLCSCWFIWFHRNKVVHGGDCWDVNAAAGRIRHWFDQYRKACSFYVVKQQDICLAWKPPQSEFIKINVDGAWDVNTGRAAFGIGARDSIGSVVFVKADQLQGICSCMEAEGLALLISMKEAKARHLKQIRQMFFKLLNSVNGKVIDIVCGLISVKHFAKGNVIGLYL